jgi:hypothetical protein
MPLPFSSHPLTSADHKDMAAAAHQLFQRSSAIEESLRSQRSPIIFTSVSVRL